METIKDQTRNASPDSATPKTLLNSIPAAQDLDREFRTLFDALQIFHEEAEPRGRMIAEVFGYLNLVRKAPSTACSKGLELMGDALILAMEARNFCKAGGEIIFVETVAMMRDRAEARI